MGCSRHCLESTFATTSFRAYNYLITTMGAYMRQAILSYLAGVMDSDGTIGIKKLTYSMRVVKDSTQATYSERIHIRQVERAAIDLLSETFGGNVGIEDPHAKRGRALFRWGLTDKKAVAALKAMLPYLRIKHAQALNCLELRKVKTRSAKARVAKGRGHVGSARRSDELSNQMESLYQKAKALNHVGI
jgi:hypothetical protein